MADHPVDKVPAGSLGEGTRAEQTADVVVKDSFMAPILMNDAHELSARLGDACEKFAAEIHYWTTPQKNCVDGSGDNCTAYNEWVDKWQQIKG